MRTLILASFLALSASVACADTPLVIPDGTGPGSQPQIQNGTVTFNNGNGVVILRGNGRMIINGQVINAGNGPVVIQNGVVQGGMVQIQPAQAAQVQAAQLQIVQQQLAVQAAADQAQLQVLQAQQQALLAQHGQPATVTIRPHAVAAQPATAPATQPASK